MIKDSLTSGLEDYIEDIYLAQINNQQLKAAQLARNLNISRASVSEALNRLVSKNLISYNSYGFITLTDLGFSKAKQVYEKHSIIKNFFTDVLDIEPDEASENACKIEHIISENILNKIKEFTLNYKKNN